LHKLSVRRKSVATGKGVAVFGVAGEYVYNNALGGLFDIYGKILADTYPR